MNRTSMPTNSGMLFVFEQKAGHCFWMNNTKIPLSIAFIADDGKIVNIEEMQAETTNNHCPKAAVRYALEMNKQWFSERVVVPGTIVTGLPKIKIKSIKTQTSVCVLLYFNAGLFKMANIVHRLLSTNNEITTLFHFPALACFKFLLRGAVDNDKCGAINHLHNLSSTQVKT